MGAGYARCSRALPWRLVQGAGPVPLGGENIARHQWFGPVGGTRATGCSRGYTACLRAVRLETVPRARMIGDDVIPGPEMTQPAEAHSPALLAMTRASEDQSSAS